LNFNIIKSKSPTQIFVTLLCIVFAYGIASAQSVEERDIASLAGLKIAPGAAQAGAAEAFGTVSTDAFSLYYNPAGAIMTGKYSTGIMHHEWIEDYRSEFVSGIISSGKVAIGASVLYNTIGDIERRNSATTDPLSLFDAQDIAAGLTGGFYLSDELSVGITAKVIYQKIDISSGTALAVDLGGYYRFTEQIELGLSVSNLGSKMKVDEEENDLPRLIRAGGAYRYRDARFGLNVVTPTDDDAHFHLGAENTFREVLTIRAGYASGYDVRSFALGFGIKHKFATLDYAFTPIESDLGNSHRFSLTFSWR